MTKENQITQVKKVFNDIQALSQEQKEMLYNALYGYTVEQKFKEIAKEKELHLADDLISDLADDFTAKTKEAYYINERQTGGIDTVIEEMLKEASEEYNLDKE